MTEARTRAAAEETVEWVDLSLRGRWRPQVLQILGRQREEWVVDEAQAEGVLWRRFGR